MNPISRIMTRSVAGPFFRLHAGFLLFFFFILFGVYPSIDEVIQIHHSVIVGILTKPSNFLIATLIWGAYAFRICTFFYRLIEKDRYNFLSNLNAVESGKRFAYLSKLSVQLYSPVLAYGAIILAVAFYDGYIAAALMEAAVFLILTLLIAAGFYYSLREDRARLSGLRKYLPRLNFPKNLFSFLMRYIFREQFVALTVLKVISFCSLYFFISTDPESYKDRTLWLIFITLIICHSIIVYRNQQFMEIRFSFYRNMPVKLVVTILTLLAVYFVILIPELWAMKGIALQHHAFGDYSVLLVTAPCMVLMMHALLYTDDYRMRDFLKILSGVWVVFFFFGLSQFRWLLAPISLAVSFILFYSSYYKYEKKMTVKGVE